MNHVEAIGELKAYINDQRRKHRVQVESGRCYFSPRYMDHTVQRVLEGNETIKKVGDGRELSRRGIKQTIDLSSRTIFYEVDARHLQ